MPLERGARGGRGSEILRRPSRHAVTPLGAHKVVKSFHQLHAEGFPIAAHLNGQGDSLDAVDVRGQLGDEGWSLRALGRRELEPEAETVRVVAAP